MIIAQIGEMRDKRKRIRQYAECDGHRVWDNGGGSVEFDLARLLIAKGYDPTSPYETRRGEANALSWRSLGEAARLTVEESIHGPRIRKWRGEK